MTTLPFPLFDCTIPRGEMMLFGLTWLASVKLGVTGELGPPLTDEFTFWGLYSDNIATSLHGTLPFFPFATQYGMERP